MTRADRVKQLAGFDVEPLLSSILAGGTWLCLSLILASVLLQWSGIVQGSVAERMQARSLPLLIVTDLRRIGSTDAWPRLLLDLAIAALMLTSYLRVLASFVYVIWMEPDRKHVLFMSFVLVVLTVILFTELV